MNINKMGNKYNVFAEKFLKQKAKPLWDQHKTCTKAERDEALTWLSQALNVNVGTRTMLQYVLRFKRMQEKRLRGYLLQCIRQKIPPELTLFMSKVPTWMKDVEAKLQMMPKLVEECRMSGLLPEDRAQEVWSKIAQMLLVESHKHQRTPTLEDVQTVAAHAGMNNYQLLYRLWTRQRESAIFKFRSLQDAGDVCREVALALTQLEWKVVDTALLYVKEFPLVCLDNKIQPLVSLYQTVIAYKVEENDNVDPKEKWAKVVHEYSKKYVTSPSGIVLQRRWWELKQQVHDNIRERLRSVEYKVHPLLVEIAAKYQCIVRDGQEDWHDLVRNGKVYDVSNIQFDFDSSDDDDSDEDYASADNGICKSTNCCDILDSDFDSDDDRPLVIDEAESKINRTKTIIPNMKNDKENPEQNSTEPRDLDDKPVTPKKDQIHDLNERNPKISSSFVEHNINRQINMVTNDSQFNYLNDTKAESQEIIMKTNDNCPKDNMIKNSPDNAIETDGSTLKDNAMTIDDSNSKDNLSESNDGDPKNNLTGSDNNNLTENIITTDDNSTKEDNIASTTKNTPIDGNCRTSNDSIITTNLCNSAGSSTMKTYSKAKPVIAISSESVRVIESELQKLELEFQIQMRTMVTIGRAEANAAEKRKQNTKKGDDKIEHDISDPSNTRSAKVNKTYSSKRDAVKSSLTKKKSVKMCKHIDKETKVNPASNKINTTDSINVDANKDNLATDLKNVGGNLAAKSLIENMDTNIQTTTEKPNDEPKTVIATIYTCKGQDGRELGHVILPTPIDKDVVPLSIKTNTETDIKIPSNEPIQPISVSPLKEIKQPSNEILQPLNETIQPSNETIQPSNETMEPVNKSKESDLVLLQKINPAQAQTMIIFSDSEDESENVPINDTIQDNLPDINDSNQENIPNLSETNLENVLSVTAQKEDYINLNDVKKYLSNHSLDDILTKMGDMAFKKEVKKTQIKSANRNRISESVVYVSDSDDDNPQNNEKLSKSHDVSMENDSKKVTDIQNDPAKVFEMLGCRSNECTMIYDVTLDNNVRNNIITAKEAKETIIKTDEVLNVPNSTVLILPPIFFETPNSLVSTTNITSPSTNMVERPQIVPSLTSNVEKPTSTLSPPTVSNIIPNTQIPPPLVLSRTPNVATPTPNAVLPTPPLVKSSTPHVKIPTPNSNVVTMIVDAKISQELQDQNPETDEFKNVFDDVMSVDGDLTINKNQNSKVYKNKLSDKKQRRTRTYNETAGYSGLFQLKNRSTKETVGMLCRIKEEKSLVSEVTEKINNYLGKFDDSQSNIEKQNEFYVIINKKLEIESKKSSSDGYLKKLLDNCPTNTLWTGKEAGDEEKPDEGKSDEETNTETIDPKLIMDARVYLPKLDEVESYNKNRRVDFSINSKRISKVGYKILNHKMKSDDPNLITDITEPKSTAPIAEHIETEIAVASKNKVPEAQLNNKVSKENANERSRKRPISVDKSKTKPKSVELMTEKLDSLTKQIMKEREIQHYINPNRASAMQKLEGGSERITSLTEKIKNERQKQQLLDNKTNIVQRIKFEADDDFVSNDDTRKGANVLGKNEKNTNLENIDLHDKSITERNSELQIVQETTNDNNNKEFDVDKNVFHSDDMDNSEGSEDMELETVSNNTLILDSSNALKNKQDPETDTDGTNDTKISKNSKEMSINDKNRKINVNPKSHNENERLAVSVKIEAMETETHLSNYLTSDDDDIPLKIPKKVKKMAISSEEEDNVEQSPKADIKTYLRNIKNEIPSDDEDRWSYSDVELGLRIESELLKEASALDLLQTENGLLKEIKGTNDVPVTKSNIEKMLKLCKPVRLCLERVQVPKDTSQVRKVELPDRMSLKRHRAPTAHVAPITVSSLQIDSDSEGPPEVTAEGDATEAEIDVFLQQLRKETESERYLLEESVKPKRPRVSDAEPSFSRKDKKNSEQNNVKKTDKNKRKKDEKKQQQQPQKGSDDEIDATLEWQRQKNINNRFFSFNPICKTIEEPHNSRKDKKTPKPNKKFDLLVKKLVVDNIYCRMHETEVIDLDKSDEEKKEEINKETQAAVKSIINDTNTVVQSNRNTNNEAIQLTSKGNKLLNTVPKEIRLTPIFTKIEPKFVETDVGLRPKASELSNVLIPIATKVEFKKEPEVKESPSVNQPAIIKKYYSKKIVKELPTKKINDSYINSQPSTSKDSIITSDKDPIPSNSKANDNFICISDDSNDIFELTQIISVKNNNSNVNKERSKESISLLRVTKNHNLKKQTSPPATAPQPIITGSPDKRKSSKDLNPQNEKPKISSIINAPLKVYDSMHLRYKNCNDALKIMEIGPIKSDASGLELIENNKNYEEVNGTDKCPQITNVTSISSSIEIDDNESNDGLAIDENAVTDLNEKEQIQIDQSAPRIENVMSVQSIGPNNLKKISNSSVEENNARGMGLIIQNVKSMSANIDLVDNKIDSNAVANSEDEHYDSDFDTLQMDESFSTEFDEENTEIPSTSNNPDQKPKDSVTLLKFEYSRAGTKNIVTPKNRLDIITRNLNVNIHTNKNIDDESDSSNTMIGEISNIKSERLKVKSIDSIKTPSKYDKDMESSTDVQGPTINNSKEMSQSSNKDESKSIDNKTEGIDSDLSGKDSKIDENLDRTIGNDDSITNNVQMEVDDTEKSKVNEKEFINLYTEKKLSESPISNKKHNSSNNNIESSKGNDSTAITSNNKQNNSITTNMNIEKSTENNSKQGYSEATNTKESKDNNSKSKVVQAKCTENQKSEDDSKQNDTENNEPKPEKPKTFLKVVPIQKLREPVVTTENATKQSVTKDIKLRGQAMPFQCVSDEEASKSTPSDEENACFGGNMPVISNVMSLSSIQKVPTDKPSTSSQVTFVALQPSKPDSVSGPKIWKSGRIEQPTSLLKRVDLSQMSSLPPVTVADFIKDRDCTDISLLCIDEWKPLWMFRGENLIVTNLKLPFVGPSYWTTGPRAHCTRVEMDDNASGSTIVGALSVPDEVFLDNNWYKKLSTDPMIYAKIWYVVPDAVTCREMLNCNVKMQLYNQMTGAFMPLVVLNQKHPKPTQYRINTKHLESLQVPELVTFVKQLVVDGNLEPKDMFRKPVAKVTSDEVINLDSDDE